MILVSPSPPPVTRIIIVDDESIVRTVICVSLSALPNFQVIAETDSGKEAIRLCEELKPDLVLLDLKMKDLSGLEVAPVLLKKNPALKIIVNSAYLDNSLIPILFSYGVLGFFNKADGFQELTTAIRKVSLGCSYTSLYFKKTELEKKKATLSPLDLLSERELQVALLIYYGMNTHEICKRLKINVSTLKTYRSRLSEKLGIQNDIEITVLVERFKLLQNK